MVVSVGRDIDWPVDGAQRCNWKIKIISRQNIIGTRTGGATSHLHLRSQLLFGMEERALAAADRDFVFGPKHCLCVDGPNNPIVVSHMMGVAVQVKYIFCIA